jgi:Rrf2 family protein
MRFTLETDYAIRIVDYLSRKGTRVGAQQIAEKSGVTLRFSLKILRKLVGQGIVRSYKGVQGGYEIALPLDQISIADIVATIEGDYLISRCLEPGHECIRNQTGSCPYHELFGQISADVQQKLAGATMQSVIGG